MPMEAGKKLTTTQLNRVVAMMNKSLKESAKDEKKSAVETKVPKPVAAKPPAVTVVPKAVVEAAAPKTAASKKRPAPAPEAEPVKKTKKAAELPPTKASTGPRPASKTATTPSKKPTEDKPAASVGKRASAQKAKPAEVATAPSPKGDSAKAGSAKGKGKAKDPEEEVRKVEKICGVRPTKAGDTEFLIKWQGLSQRDCTWEPEDHILDDGLVDDFMKSKLVKMAPSGGRYAVGTPVEVLGEAEGFEYSWAPAKVLKVSKAGLKYEVEYADFMENKKKLVEKDIEMARLRPAQPKNPAKKWKPLLGDMVEVFEDDCWWEAKVLAFEAKKKEEHAKVMLRVSDEKKSYPLSVMRPSCWWTAGKK